MAKLVAEDGTRRGEKILYNGERRNNQYRNFCAKCKKSITVSQKKSRAEGLLCLDCKQEMGMSNRRRGGKAGHFSRDGSSARRRAGAILARD